MRLKDDVETMYRLICGGVVRPTVRQVKKALGDSGPSYELLRKWRDPKSPVFPSQHQLLYLLGKVSEMCPDDTSGRQTWISGVLYNWWAATKAEYAAMGGLYLPPFDLVGPVEVQDA